MAVPPLRLGRGSAALVVDPPVVLAPMAGITDVVFRDICRHHGAALYVAEMIHARLFVEGAPRVVAKARFGPDERPRSAQLYARTPEEAKAAVVALRAAADVDHVDLNFGCPAPKVVRSGGGAAIPADLPRFRAIVRATVEAAGPVPVTVKMRMGLTHRHTTYLEAGTVAAEEGVAAVALHARTAEDRYGPPARWEAIADLVRALDPLPVLGNGDVFSGADALRMLERTGCAGVVVGRGCMGRPWLFRELADTLAGRTVPPPPTLGENLDAMLAHARAHVAVHGPQRLLAFRRHAAAYAAGYPSAASVRAAIFASRDLDELARVVRTAPRHERLVHRTPTVRSPAVRRFAGSLEEGACP
ncbi:MAG: tRNA dihydrouridine synthase DusB [Deltaproteobacteria bacterium]|nr:MAG: tRNA dihydrouridine synthase DusB [Deltaproteobacteria bacterium]